MNEIDFYGFKVQVDNNYEFTVTNLDGGLCNLRFFNPDKYFWGSNFPKFCLGCWAKTKPTTWSYNNVKENGIVELQFEYQDKKLILEYDFENNTFKDKTDKFHKIVKGETVIKDISVLIPAFDVVNYMDETIDKFIEIDKKFKYLNIEFIIGIDGCDKTFKHISEKVYPNNFTVVLSEKNYGEPIMKNSLINICKNEKFIVFDSDDIPTEDMINILWEKLEENDFVLYRSYNYWDGEDLHENNISVNYWGGCFAGIKSKFIENNGWYPWRVSADDEFKHRIILKKDKNFKELLLDEPLFYYRIRNNSSSRDKLTKKDSFLRKAYLDLMTDKIGNKKWDNPERFYYNENLILIQ